MTRAPTISAFPLPRDQVAARLAAGVPLLHEQPLQLDAHFALSRLQATLAAEPGPAAAALDQALTSGTLDGLLVVDEAFVQHPAHLADLARAAAVDPDLLAVRADTAVAPIRHAYAEQLRGPLERGLAEVAWPAGYCPICGAWPATEELAAPGASDGPSTLVCAGCGTRWPWSAARCPFCRTETQQVTAPAWRACDVCGHYVCRQSAPCAAPARGYTRPIEPGYPVELAMPDADWLAELA